MTDLRGSLDSQPLPAVFLFLQDASKTGRLRLEGDGVSRSFFIRDGVVIGVESSARSDSLEWLLFRAGVLSEERHGRVRAHIDSGARRGPALIETGGLSPATICQWTERRTRFLMGDVLFWDGGEYIFEEGTAPPDGAIDVKISPRKTILKALREKGPRAVASSFPGAETIPNRLTTAEASACLEPQEAYVISLADGRRSVQEICHVSEFGETETLGTLSLLSTAGFITAGEVPIPVAAATASIAAVAHDPFASLMPEHLGLPEGDAPTEIRAIVRVYNDLYVHIATTMVKEIGPIAEQLLEKTLQETRTNHTTLFHRINGTKDGALPEETVIRNLNLIRDTEPREALLRGLGEHLTAMLLAVRRILGPDHETLLAGQLKELRCTST